MSPLKKLQDRQVAVVAAMRALSDKAAEEDGRPLDEEEQTAYDAHKADLEQIKVQLAREGELQEIERGLQVIPDTALALTPAEEAKLEIKGPAFVKDPKKGFESHRDFLMGVLDAVGAGRVEDPRLRFLATAGSDEAGTYADPYGNFLVPSGFSPQLLSVSSEADPVAGLTTKVPMETPILDIAARVDKDHQSSVSGGLRVYRRVETQSVTASRMELEQVKLSVNSLFGVSYATEELLERSAFSFVALLDAGFRDEFAGKLLDERINGTGVGMFEGVLNTPCLISVAKETGQAADTIVYENIIKMRAQCWRYGTAIWLANHNTLPQLMTLVMTGGVASVPVWQPSAREDAPDLLLGRPIKYTEFLPALGDTGDILLGNWGEYLEGTFQPMRSAESVHVRFEQHEKTFKFWLENDGRVWWRTYLTPRYATTTYLSPFVDIAERA